MTKTEFSTLITKILSQEILLDRPPVLVDVGASYYVHPIWKEISKYAICLAFDPDIRETEYLVEEDKGFLKLFTLPYIVSTEKLENKKFYLTNSPYCSSTLPPITENLQNYSFRRMFDHQKNVELPSRCLTQVLDDLSIDRIDWLKTDSQGTDLRIFESLPLEVKKKICAIDFEPGIIDAYEGEDKLHHILKALDNYPFWVSDLEVKGVPRIIEPIENKLKHLDALRTSPCWAEVTYLNNFSSNGQLGEREYFLGWIFSNLRSQYGFSAQLAEKGLEKYKNPLFQECFEVSKKALIPKKRTFKIKLIDYLTRKIQQLK